MKKKITKEYVKEFRSTDNGRKKYFWLILGMIIDFISTLSVSLIIIYSDAFSYKMFYILLYIALVIVVVGGEFIGTYFGALEQYVDDKNSKKTIDYLDS